MKLPKVKDRAKDRVEKKEKIPGSGDNFLAAKVVAYRHAMENMPEDAKRFGSKKYIAAGVGEADPKHQLALITELQGIDPPVVPQSQIYSRSENSKWMDGKPALIWTSKIKGVNREKNVVMIVGWMHSNIIREFFIYELNYAGEESGWQVVDFEVVEQPAEQPTAN